MDADYIRNRITELRLRKDVSEYQMSYDLGHSRGYIYNISSGKCLPPMNEFLAICDYFDISPADFFQTDNPYPDLTRKVINEMSDLSEEDIELIIEIIEHLKKKAP